MRIRKKKWAEPELSVCNFYVKNPEENAGKWMQAFKKEQPLYLEIGCGKGGFAGQLALKNPDKNIIALDIKVDMLGVGRRTIVKLFEDAGKTQDDITNLLLVKYNVEMLDKIITADDKIDRLFINFCNPWPRAKHKKRRLTYYKKLEMYKTFLKPDSRIRFKTVMTSCLTKVLNTLNRADMKFCISPVICTQAMLPIILKQSMKKCSPKRA